MAPLPQLHLILYPAPPCDQLSAGPTLRVDNQPLRTVRLASGAQPRLFSMSFEQLQARLEAHPQSHFEPDGSFLWSGVDNEGEGAWQLTGMLYDAAGRLQRIEIRGTCPLANWRQWLNLLDWPMQPLIIQLLEDGCLVMPDECENLWRAEIL